MSEFTITADSPAATQALGRHLASLLQPGDLIALEGNLGAGKTFLTQEVCAGLGVDREQVGSPTFVLIQEYDGRLPIFHMDCYRLADVDEFLELGVDEILGGNGVCLIEWADRVAEALPADRLTIRIEAIGQTSREFRITSGGERSDRLAQSLRRQIPAQ